MSNQGWWVNLRTSVQGTPGQDRDCRCSLSGLLVMGCVTHPFLCHVRGPKTLHPSNHAFLTRLQKGLAGRQEERAISMLTLGWQRGQVGVGNTRDTASGQEEEEPGHLSPSGPGHCLLSGPSLCRWPVRPSQTPGSPPSQR